MKALNKIFGFAIGALLLTGCNDLDTVPLGGTVTESQKKEVMDRDPEMAKAGVQGLPRSLKNVLSHYDGLHTDFGYGSLMLILDSRGEDMPAINAGYNWYSAAAEMSDFGNLYYDNLIFWNTLYDNVYVCNSLCQLYGRDEESASGRWYRAQALAFRAWDYFNLVQMYQFTYVGNEDKPAIPVLTEENALEAPTIGCPRSTVAEVYAQIIKDLDEAIAFMSDEAVTATAIPTKNFITLPTAYGLRARANLFKADWAAAAADARKAIELAGAAGITPTTTAEASQPAFFSVSEHNWMWGIIMDATDPGVSGVVNFPSMMGSWMSKGYCSTGVYRCINKKLYDQIVPSDVRKNWWLDGKATVPSTLPAAYRDVATNPGSYGMKPFLPYTQVKYGAPGNQPGGTVGNSDIPLMRVEEMYLIEAEALGMQTPANGVTALTSFVQAYRNPGYALSAGTTDAFREAIRFQRRIELWGEGFSYYDMMRYKVGINRVDGGFPDEWTYVVEPTDPVLLYVIPQPETNANPMISEAEADNGASVPTSVILNDSTSNDNKPSQIVAKKSRFAL